MGRLLIIFFLFFSANNTFAANNSAQPPVPFDASIDQLFGILKKNNVANITEAIALLDGQYFKSENYALIFDSLSPQSSTQKNPRVLLFGKDKKIRMGFNHRHKNGQDLEVIQWKPLTKVWEFREIQFKHGKPHLSKANPNTCIQCHDDYKPKFQGHWVHSLRRVLKKKMDRSEFKKQIKSDSVYRRLELSSAEP